MLAKQSGLFIFVIAISLAGCSPRPVDLSRAYWGGRGDPALQSDEGWPRWDRTPGAAVQFGESSVKATGCFEWARFLWDETGLYGEVLAFSFPQIEVTCGDTAASRTVILTARGEKMYETLGEVRASEIHAGRRRDVAKAHFRSVDHGWVAKPGQCSSEFWVSWEALGSDGVPQDQVTIRVKGQVLILKAARALR
jgi:hypothetical protein